MQNTPYTLTELIQNDDFIAWVLRPDEENEVKWKQYQDEFPTKIGMIEDARGYVILLAEDTGKHIPTPEQSVRMWKNVESRMQQPVAQEETEPPAVVPLWRKWYMAASIGLLAGVGIITYLQSDNSQRDRAALNESGKAEVNAPFAFEKFNATTKPMTVLLDDGSSVVLYPGARLFLNSSVSFQKREVRLVGMAFFEIVKNPARPFFVYTNALTTKVLGTSFLVDAREDNREVNVEVKTGKVSVYPGNGFDKEVVDQLDSDKPDSKGIVLVQDQKIAISRLDGKPVRIVENNTKAIESVDIAQQLFIFDETPVSEVFRSLENSYNIKITYDNEVLGNCPLNATLIGQPFHKKLSVICSALGLKFEIKEDEVVITGNGCE